MTDAQRFFFISGIIFWYLAAIAVMGFISYLIVRSITETKGKKGRKIKRRELHESMGRRRKGA